MESHKKRKRDVDCPRITYDTSTKVFDRLFKEESLEEMKNVVRKKLGLSSSLSVHLSQLRDGKLIVLEDDDDFDAFYASIHSTAVAKIKVYLGDDQPSRTGPDADLTGVSMQLPGSPNIHPAEAEDDEPSPTKKLKVSFDESDPQSVGNNVEEPYSSQALPNSEPPPEVPVTLNVTSAEGDNVEELNLTVPNSKPPLEVPVTLDAISADAEGAHETSNKAKKKKTGNTTRKRKKGKKEDPLLEDQSLGKNDQSDIAVVTRKDPEASQGHIPSIGEADPSGVDVSTQPPTKKVRMEVVIVGKESKDALSAPIAATSDSKIVVKRAKKQDPKPIASTSAPGTIPSDSKGKTGEPSNSKLKKTQTRKSRKKEEPVDPPESNDKDEALLISATKAAVDAILGRRFLSSNDSRETATRSSLLVDSSSAPPPSIAPVTSPDDQPALLNNTKTITEQLKTLSKCPVCDKAPYHLRSKCPIIKAGIIAMRKRIAELQQNTPDDKDEERVMIIEELQRIIDKRTKRSQTGERGSKSTNVKSTADKSVVSPVLAADSSSVIKPTKTSQTVQPTRTLSVGDEPKDDSFRSQSRTRHPNSEVQEEEEEEEEEEEASHFMRSILPLPTRSTSDLSSPSDDLQGDTSFRKVNDFGSSIEVDKTGDDPVNDAYALDLAHLSALKPSENGRKASNSDTIETFENPESTSSQSPIVSVEDDIHPRQSTPKADVAGYIGRQRISSSLVRKPSAFTFKPSSTPRTVNGTNNIPKSAKKTGGLSRITDLPIPIISNTKPLSDKGRAVKRTLIESSDEEAAHPEKKSVEEHEDHQQVARDWVETQEADEQGPMDASQATRTKTPAKVPVPLTTKRNAEQSLASWEVLEGNSLGETGSLVDEIRYSSDTQPPAVVNGVSDALDPLFLHSESQQSFPYSQYPNALRQPPDSEDEEDEVQAFVVKPRTSTKSSSKFRSLTEIASQPTLFTPTVHLTPNNGTKEEMINLYGRVNKGDEKEESSSDSDTDSESDSDAQVRKSHIPMSRRAGIHLK